MPISDQIKQNYLVKGFQWVTVWEKLKPEVQLSTLHLLVLALAYVKYGYQQIRKTRFIISCFCGSPKIMICEYGIIDLKKTLKSFYER